MSQETGGRKWHRALCSLAVVWLFLVGFLFLQSWPNLPRSNLQWLLFVALGPPLYVLGEALFGWLFSPVHGHAISRRTFSVVRVAIVLPVVFVLFALSWWLSWLLSKS